MKKDKAKDQEQKPRRLNLSRETIRSLNDPALLEHAKAGTAFTGSNGFFGCCQTTSDSGPVESARCI